MTTIEQRIMALEQKLRPSSATSLFIGCYGVEPPGFYFNDQFGKRVDVMRLAGESENELMARVDAERIARNGSPVVYQVGLGLPDPSFFAPSDPAAPGF